MSKQKPNINVPYFERDRFKSLVLEIIDDSWIYTHNPDLVELNGELFTLTLSNKKFVFEELKVDKFEDYVDVYFQGIKKPADLYTISVDGNDIVINFTQSIMESPEVQPTTDFEIKGKIVDRL